MNPFIISTDTCCDLPASYLSENDIDTHSLFYRFDDDVYGEDRQLNAKEFFDRIRNGGMPTTMGSNPESVKNLFKKRIEAGYDILHLSFSQALSVTYQSTVIAANEVLEEYPNARIEVIDTKCASMGQGLLVYKAMEKKNSGASMDELISYVEELIPHIEHIVTVDDLFHLHRGGRVSKATAIAGTLAGIKPQLYVNDDGKLEACGKVRGRKKALAALVDTADRLMGSYRDKNDVVMIVHDDTTQDAEFVASLVREKLGVKNIILNSICPTIGAHTGPGVVALFCLGDTRS